MTRRTALLLVLLSLTAFAARAFTDYHFKAWQSPNAMEHRSIAMALATGRGFTFGDWGYYGPTSVQSPPFPFLLAGLFRLFHAVTPDMKLVEPGASLAYGGVMLINALAGAAVVWLTYGMARTIGASTAAAVLAAGLVAVWPTQVYAARAVQAISLITCGLAAMTILYYRAVRTGSPGAWTGYAFVAVLVTLVEPAFLPAMLLSGLLMLLSFNLSYTVRLRNLAVMAFAIFAVIGPWAARNFIVHDKIIPIKGTFWVNVWKGANDSASGSDRLAMKPAQRVKAWKANGASGDDLPDTPHQYDMLTLAQRNRLANHPEAFREAIFREYSIDWIKTHPARFFQLCAIRLAKSLTVDWDNPRAYNPVYGGSRLAAVVLSVCGLIFAMKQRWSLLFPALLFTTAIGTYTVTLTAARFAFPFEPFQLALGAGFIVAVVRGMFPVRTQGI